MRFVDLEQNDPRISKALTVLRELRPDLTADALVTIMEEGGRQGLRFTVALDGDGRCLGVAGWRVMASTVAGRKLYVDDLVTTASSRSQGVGRALLGELERRAGEEGCSVLDLDSGVHRTDAHRFYLREGLSITSLHFTRLIPGPSREQ